ncbi:hypothetical protein HPB51_009039 [Rhipicephalus microplus]|uniref:Transmembrane protein n=1 Tax=Rhipicephalus microplus TaxID=6941 RepID=A0A9J6D9A5_RHIMP|nr:hypothetical protein HPB51_009039 [Rhipicephalus microplus]
MMASSARDALTRSAMIRARRETPFRFTGDLGSASCGWLTMAVHLNPCALATLVLLLLGWNGSRNARRLNRDALSALIAGGAPRLRCPGSVYQPFPEFQDGERDFRESQPDPLLYRSPHEDRTMPEKSNNGGSKDNDRWKVKAIPFPPSAERRDTGECDANSRRGPVEKPSFGHPGEACACPLLFAQASGNTSPACCILAREAAVRLRRSPLKADGSVSQPLTQSVGRSSNLSRGPEEFKPPGGPRSRDTLAAIIPWVTPESEWERGGVRQFLGPLELAVELGAPECLFSVGLTEEKVPQLPAEAPQQMQFYFQGLTFCVVSRIAKENVF